jgi:hypothetical protein
MHASAAMWIGSAVDAKILLVLECKYRPKAVIPIAFVLRVRWNRYDRNRAWIVREDTTHLSRNTLHPDRIYLL